MGEISIESARTVLLNAAAVLRESNGKVKPGELNACRKLLKALTKAGAATGSAGKSDHSASFMAVSPELRNGIKRGFQKVLPPGAKRQMAPTDAGAVCRMRYLVNQIKPLVEIRPEMSSHVADVFEAVGEELAPEVIAANAAKAAA